MLTSVGIPGLLLIVVVIGLIVLFFVSLVKFLKKNDSNIRKQQLQSEQLDRVEQKLDQILDETRK